MAAPPAEAPARCDLVIRGGEVIDGTGAPRRRADLAVAGERVVAIGDLGRTAGAVEIDASGRAVAPGFIDVHTHDDRLLLSGPDMAPKVSQGVTTVIAGNCGISLAPLRLTRRPPPPLDLLGDERWWHFGDFGTYAEAIERAPAATNVAMLVGHSTLRVGTMDSLDRPARDGEVERMRALLAESLRQGAIGLSTGLFYPTARSAPTDEVVAIAGTLKALGGLYVTHMRDEADHVEESIDETLEIGRRAGVPVVISHHKTVGRRNFGRTRETLAKIERARARQAVGLDVYPYIASSSVISIERIRMGIPVLVSWSVPHPEAAGRDLDDVAAEWGCDRVEAAERLKPGGAIYFQLDEEDVRRVLSYPHAMIGSDGLPHDARPHPRLWGTFPRVLGHYARDLGLFGLEEAVRRMTGLPAACFGIADRGVVRAGAFADLVVFDPLTVIDRATFDEPVRPAAGIDAVVVNGRVVWRAGASTGDRPGRLLRRGSGAGPSPSSAR
ncbi:MAG: D-aminoacylase [Proteobacteria bacterium]|nr:D-aminoacylase [Pseudomonadota bacterium]